MHDSGDIMKISLPPRQGSHKEKYYTAHNTSFKVFTS
jgi:hypothetical protein